MATIVTNEVRNAQMGNPTHSVIDFDTDTIASSLLDETDSGTITATTVDYDELDTAVVVHPEEAHASKTVGSVGAGVYDAADLDCATVSGDAVDWLTVHKDTGTPATSPVAVGFDSATTGLPLTPNGGNVAVAWAAGGILQI
jgi:hypothetical protein